MSVFGSRGSADSATEAMVAGAAVLMEEEEEEEEEEPAQAQAGTSLMAVEPRRKRKGDTELRGDLHTGDEDEDNDEDDEDLSRLVIDDQQAKLKCSREPHWQIEKRRRDKMNKLIDDLACMIPSCQGPNVGKLAVLRKAVQHFKALRAPPSTPFMGPSSKSDVLPHRDLQDLLLKVADGFLLVTSCDGAKILFVSDSVYKTLSFSQLELTGKCLFDFIHHKDINKVKEQLVTSSLYHGNRRPSSESGLEVLSESAPRPAVLNSGGRRAFFCRMKQKRVARMLEEPSQAAIRSKKKDKHKYCTLHCTGYLHRWASGLPGSCPPEQGADAQVDTSNPACLVTVCRPLGPGPTRPPKDVNARPLEFITRCAIDGKFTFVDQRATAVIGYLPQEIVGTSCYEYFHQADLWRLAEKHRQALRSQEKVETPGYRFKTKHGSYVLLKSQWVSFKSPWTKEVEFIVSVNRVVSWPKPEEAGNLKEVMDDTKLSPVIPGLYTDFGTMIYAGNIGTQIANELSSLPSGAPNPLVLNMDKVPFGSSHNNLLQMSARDEMPGCSSKPQSELETVGGLSGAASHSQGDPSQLDLDHMALPGPSSVLCVEASHLDLDHVALPGLSSVFCLEPPQLDLDILASPRTGSATCEEETLSVLINMLGSDENAAQSEAINPIDWDD